MPLDDTLFKRLRLAKRPDLLALINDLKLDLNKYKELEDPELIDLISRELRSAAGNSVINMSREDHDFPYEQILIDVADKLCEGRFKQTSFTLSGPETEEDIESYIYERINNIWKKHIESLSSKDKAKLQDAVEKDLLARGLPSQLATGAVSTLMTGVLTGVLVAPVVATAIFGSLWTMLFGMSFAQLLAGGVLGGGPIGLVFAGLAVATGPSYKKTIPCIVRLIFIKVSHEAEEKL
jgi:uncharacterized protein YaaW (UPF0174 family)